MIKLNAGDKVICIKERFSDRRNTFNHIKGKIYVILNYNPLNDDGTGFENYKVTGEVEHIFFTLSSFDKYFLTIKEFRKQKLEKINGCNL